MFQKLLVTLLFLVCLGIGIADPPCTTYWTPVWCGSCHEMRSGCWQSGDVSYNVYGTPEETWCNSASGYCSYYTGCENVHSITVAVDCEGYRAAYQGDICCTVY